MTQRLLAILVCFILAAPSLAQTTITMKVAARVKPGQPILVRDVADIQGENADTLAPLVLIADPSAATPAGATWLEVAPSLIKDAAQTAGISPDRLTLRGTPCAVRFTGLGTLAGMSDTPPPQPTDTPAPAQPTTQSDGLVRGVVLARLAQLLQAAPEDLRVTFDDRDNQLLDTLTAGRRVLAVPTVSALSQRIPVRVTIFEQDRLIEERTITTEVLVRTNVIALLTGVERGTEITPAHIAERSEWLAPSPKPPATRTQTLGAVAKSRLDTGRIITATDVEPPIAVKRGEIVYVDCLSGKLRVKVRARAQATARDGEIVELKIDESEGSFLARMNGKGRAVMLVGNSDAL